jgi:hypothetical protein
LKKKSPKMRGHPALKMFTAEGTEETEATKRLERI